MRLKILIALLGFIGANALGETLTLDQAQQLAQSNYPLIKRYDLISQSTRYTISNVARGWLPQLGIGAQVTLQNQATHLGEDYDQIIDQDQIKISGDVNAADDPVPVPSDIDLSGVKVEFPPPNVKGMGKLQYRVGAEVNQTIWEGGTISGQKKVAQLESEIQQSKTDVDLYGLRERVCDLYFGILLLDEQLRLCDEMIALLEDNERKLESLQRGGVVTGGDVAAIKAEKMKTRQQRTQLTNSRRSFERVLNVFIGKDEATQLTLVKPADQIVSTTSQRPELLLLDKQWQLTQAQERLLRSSLMPRITAFAQGFYGYPGFDMMHDVMHRAASFNGLVGLKVQWSINPLYTYKNDKARLALQRSDIETQRETFLFNSRLKSAQESEMVSGYRKLMADDDEIIELRVTVRKAAESKLNHGIIDVNNLLQEIVKENQARIAKCQHELEMLQHTYKMKIIHNT